MMPDDFTMFFLKGSACMSCRWSQVKRRSSGSADFIPAGNGTERLRFLGLNFIGSKIAKVSSVQNAERHHPNSVLHCNG
jgi:hypothetical protein